MTTDSDPIYMAAFIRRATVRKLRLHACACMRLHSATQAQPELLALVEVAERYADGEIGAETLAATPASWPRHRRPGRGDFDLAYTTDDRLRLIWDRAAEQNRTYEPTEPDYRVVLPRYRIFEELLGPDPLPVCSPDWRTDTAMTLARQMYESREFSAMPILADALQDAGCDDPAILDHCRDTSLTHVRGCWVTDLVLNKS